MANETPRIMLIGAHPDDVDIKAGGTASKWASMGCEVLLVSLTDGRAGHHEMAGPRLVERRKAEAKAAADVIGASYHVLDWPDGALNDRLEYRHQLIRMIRAFRPDVVITHRTNDYHPDHRFAGLLVQDASYLLTVPAICPDVPHLARSPVILLFSDAFTRPCRFEPHVVVDIEDEFERVVSMLHCHQSQFYEWLPYNSGHPDDVPDDEASRRAWLADSFRRRIAPLADRYREQVIRVYGPDEGPRARYIEAFEVSEFGAPLDGRTWQRIFPFLPPAPEVGMSQVSRRWVDLPGGS
ncbi:PIG-L family deacetylase [Tautonia sp. JC769]|uniref:PIG-L deacetylase family protein n=1 Tax=Tautonia sp. JC769 TaxID=3232135 RepID=UPI00345949DA